MGEAAPQAADTGAVPDTFGTLTPGSVRETFDQWRVFEASGRWWALRSGMTREQGPASLIQPALMATSLVTLAEMLSLQEWLRSLSAGELEAVWRGGTMAVAP